MVAKDVRTYRWIYGNDGSGVDDGVAEATETDVHAATSCLQQCVRVLAKMLTDPQNADPSADVDQLPLEKPLRRLAREDSEKLTVAASSTSSPSGRGSQSSHSLLDNQKMIRESKKEIEAKGKVVVPTLKFQLENPVMKITLPNGGNARPDPILLAFRAAVNWSVCTGTPRLPLGL